MKWSLLKSNRCPSCHKDLATSETVMTAKGPGIKHPCGFVISNVKFSSILADRIPKHEIEPDDEESI